MTDLWGDWVENPLKPIVDILAYPSKSLDATYIWLTKRVGNMCDTLRDITDSYGLLTNHYFGFTAENQEWYEKRMAIVNERFPKWANLWISAEPLLGPIDLRWDDVVIKPKVVIVGCESGPNRRPCNIEWVESIVEQCIAVGVPVFVKQICLPNGKFTNKIEEFPAHLRIRQVPWAKESQTNNN